MKENGNKINLVLKLDHPWIALNHFKVSHFNMKNNKTAKKRTYSFKKCTFFYIHATSLKLTNVVGIFGFASDKEKVH